MRTTCKFSSTTVSHLDSNHVRCVVLLKWMELFAQKAMEPARANTAANDARVVAPFQAAGADWKAREAKESKFASPVSMKPVKEYQV